jgi:UDP-GlcNAc:undecaprenyl-phosphate/decaprenyl-phosphate GlcNAc-1-phosphate transferase
VTKLLNMDTIELLIRKASSPETRMFFAFALSVIVTFYAIPVVVRIAKQKNLCDLPNERGSHSDATPTLGGIALFCSIVITSLISITTCGYRDQGTLILSSFYELPYLIAGITILFFIGIKDDMLLISPWKKFTGQFIAMVILSAFGGLRISSFQGLLGIQEVPYILSVLFTVFVGLGIINAINLIDGIDGLAAAIIIVASSVFGTWFYLAGEKEYTVFAACMLGTLLPYFYFNVFGKSNKIFMGDTGSLILGLIVTALAIKFIEVNKFAGLSVRVQSAPIVAIGILLIPLFDTVRVLVVRIMRNGSPFKADRGHLHHILVDLGFSHLQATIILAALSLFFAFLAFILQGMNPVLLLLFLSGFIGIITWVTTLLRQRKLTHTRTRVGIPAHE